LSGWDRGRLGWIPVVVHLGAKAVVAVTWGDSRGVHGAYMPGTPPAPGAWCRAAPGLSTVSWFEPETGDRLDPLM
jgi:hypothetical protein